MEIKQTAALVNNGVKQLVGESALLTEDLANAYDLGKTVENLGAETDAYRGIINKIAYTEVRDREYTPDFPSFMRNAWEFGSIVEKIRWDLIDATDSDMWNLQDGASYPVDIFYNHPVRARYHNQRETFDLRASTPKKQFLQSFNNGTTLNAFWSAKANALNKSVKQRIDKLAHALLAGMIAETVKAEISTADPGATTGVKFRNLEYEWNTAHQSDTVTEATWQDNPDFIRYCVKQILDASQFMRHESTLYNITGLQNSTSTADQRLITLAQFDSAYKTMLLPDIYHGDNLTLPDHEIAAYMQASGTIAGGNANAFSTTSAINVKTADGTSIAVRGVIACLYDKDAIAICNPEISLETEYNKAARFFTDFYNVGISQNVDPDENFVVFCIQDTAAA